MSLASGQASYDAWYEIIPVPEIASTIAVHPGDAIDCSISQVVPGLWTIALNDTTDGQGFTQTVPYPSDESTAEWIEETPTEIGTSGANLAALPNLTTVQFSAGHGERCECGARARRSAAAHRRERQPYCHSVDTGQRRSIQRLRLGHTLRGVVRPEIPLALTWEARS